MAIKSASTVADPASILADMSATELTALIKAAEEKRDAKMADAKRDLVEEMKNRAEQLGLSLEDLLPRPAVVTERSTARKVGSKTQDVTHRLPSGATRTARGRRSGAYTAELEELKLQGKNEEEFRV